MKSFVHRFLFLCFVLPFLQACSEKRSVRMENMDVVTHSIGRNFIDLPSDFSMVSGTTANFVPVFADGLGAEVEISIIASNVPKSQFENRIADRKKTLAAAGGGGEDELKAVITESDNCVLFRVMEVGDSYLSEMNVYMEGTYFRIVGHSYHGKFENIESSMRKFIKRISSASQKSNAEAFHLGTLSISGKNLQEIADFVFKSAKRPDLVVSVAIDTYGKDEKKNLLDRTGGSDSLLTAFDVKHRVLRKRELTIAGMRAQEWLGVAHIDNEDNYGFALETMRSDPGPARPRLHIELDSGQYDFNQQKKPNSLTDETATRLWDVMINSIRNGSESS